MTSTAAVNTTCSAAFAGASSAVRAFSVILLAAGIVLAMSVIVMLGLLRRLPLLCLLVVAVLAVRNQNKHFPEAMTAC